jgi:hypothetical protein
MTVAGAVGSRAVEDLPRAVASPSEERGVDAEGSAVAVRRPRPRRRQGAAFDLLRVFMLDRDPLVESFPDVGVGVRGVVVPDRVTAGNAVGEVESDRRAAAV